MLLVLFKLFRRSFSFTYEWTTYRGIICNLIIIITFAFSSIITSIIIVLLLMRFKDIPLPISITVNDFYGGIIIGLVAVRMGDWLNQYLFSNSAQ